jgi:formamidopyrimidine-DNA glycosylase
MPELPEVQTIVSGLNHRIIGRKIVKIQVLEPKTIQADIRQLTDKILEQKISSIWRRAKVMIWDLDNGFSLLFHLKMTGQIILDKLPSDSNNRKSSKKIASRFSGGHPTKSMLAKAKLPDKTTRGIFDLDDGSKIYFNDQRKFGWIKLMPTSDVMKDSFLATVGPEYSDSSFTQSYLFGELKKRNTSIKIVLLDQKTIAGLGNIYVDEVLHISKINPASKAVNLNRAQSDVLYSSIKSVLRQATKMGGTSFSNYVDSEGEPGDYLKHARVFRRQGLKCQECGTIIIKTKVAGRGTHWCPGCQPSLENSKT